MIVTIFLGVILVVGLLLSVALYFLPFIVSVFRDTKHQTAIGVLTMFLGWTFLGWVGALVWSFADEVQ